VLGWMQSSSAMRNIRTANYQTPELALQKSEFTKNGKVCGLIPTRDSQDGSWLVK